MFSLKATKVLVFLLSLFCITKCQIPANLSIIDGHNDLPNLLFEKADNNLHSYNFTQNLTAHAFWGRENCSESHTDLPRMQQGKIGAQFWVAYADCKTQYRDAVSRTLEQIDVIKRFVNKYSKYLQFATSVDDILAAQGNGKIASLIGIEGGHSIDSRLGVLRTMYDLGARYLTLTHNCQTPWADSNKVDLATPVHNLTEFGKKLIKEMNRIGMMVDLSHVSHNVMNAALQISRAPVIFSHSNSWTIRNHVRNVHDDTLTLLKDNNGIIMVCFYSVFVSDNSQNATIYDVMKHINYIVDLIGIDHIGIGSDFNGMDETPIGLEDTSKIPDLFKLLQEEDSSRWTPENMHKLASGNLLRVLRAVEQKRDELIEEEPLQDWIPEYDLFEVDVDDLQQIQQCTTFLEPLNTVASSGHQANHEKTSFVFVVFLTSYVLFHKNLII